MMVCMPRLRRATSSAWLLCAALPLVLPACTDGSSGDGDTGSMVSSTDDTSASESTGASAGTIALGSGQEEFHPLEEGGDLEVVFGSQGSAMFPIIIRGSEFPLPEDTTDWMHEEAPTIELWLDIEGHNDGFGGHFKRIDNYPLGFESVGDGTYDSTFVAVLLPDDKQPEDLEGLPATLWVELTPFESAPINAEVNLTVALGDLPG